MINQYLKKAYFNILSFISRLLFWFILFLSFNEIKIIFDYEEWLVFAIYCGLIYYMLSLFLKEIKAFPENSDEDKTKNKNGLIISIVLVILIRTIAVIFIIYLGNFNGAILICLMTAAVLYLYYQIYEYAKEKK